MADNILDSITEQYHSLTKSGKKLADYVFSHTAETQYLSPKQQKRERKHLKKFFHISRMTSKVSLKLWKVTLLLSVSWIRLFMSSFLQMKLTSRNLQMLRAKL